MAETLQEFLVSVKYSVDAASQNNFLSQIKRVAGSVSGVAAEIVGLAGAVLGLTKVLADAGEKFYWMSNRLGSSVNDIQSAAFAMSTLGESSEEALGSMERFGAWQRSMGPAASGWLKSLGVTASDAATQMVELGKQLRQMDYPIALRTAAIAGLSERDMRAIMAPEFEAQQKKAGWIQRQVWGATTDEEVAQKQKQWTDGAHAVMNQFREMGLFFDTVKQKFASGLFEKMLPELVRLNEFLIRNMPTINTWIDNITAALGAFIQLVGFAIETFAKLPTAVELALGAIAGFRVLKTLATSPLFLFITALTALLLLIDDYQHWKKDPGTAEFDWSGIDAMAKSLEPMLENLKNIRTTLNDWFHDLTGICHLFDFIAVTLAGILLWKAPGWIGQLAMLSAKGVAKGAAATAAEAAAAAGFGSVAGAAGFVLTVAAATILITEGFIEVDKWLQKLGISNGGKVVEDIQKQGGVSVPWWFPLPAGPGGRDPVPDWVHRLTRWPGGEQHSEVTGGGNQFAGPGAGGGAGGPVAPSGGGWAGRFLTGRGGSGAEAGVEAGQAKPLLDLIGKTEGTDVGAGYNETLARGALTGGAVNLENMTLAEVDELQTKMLANPANKWNSSAVGRYQIVRTTLRGLIKEMGLDPTQVKYDKATQDMLGAQLLKRRGLGQYLAGKMSASEFQHALALEWASIPDAGTGQSAYGQHTGGSVGATRAAMQASMSVPPLGSEMATGGAGNFLANQHRRVSVNNSTTIHIDSGPNAESTANRVAEAQTRTHEHHVRISQGKLA